MKIIAKIPRKDPKLVKVTKGLGLKAKLVKDGTMIELKNLDKKFEPGRIVEVYEIPPHLRKKTDTVYLIDCEESGGGMINAGSAMIICGINGERLKPYRIPKGYANGVHAKFLSHKCMTAVALKRYRIVKLWSHKIFKNRNTVSLISEKFWEGPPKKLPEFYSYKKFQPAAEAALKKARCYCCKEPHYIITF